MSGRRGSELLTPCRSRMVRRVGREGHTVYSSPMASWERKSRDTSLSDLVRILFPISLNLRFLVGLFLHCLGKNKAFLLIHLLHGGLVLHTHLVYLPG